MEQMSLVILLDKLEAMLEAAPRVPLTGRGLMDVDAALDLVAKIRQAIPGDVKQAEWIAQEKDRVLRQSREEAERIVSQAEEYVARLVSESEIVREARAEAERILEEARARARQVEEGADEYAERVLASLQAGLERTLQVVRNGRQELARGA